MPSATPFPEQCCTPCDDPLTVQIPGPPGDDGNDGLDGAPGQNAFTTLTAAFIMPAEGGTVAAVVGSTAWMVLNQTVFVQTAGYMTVTTITNNTTAVLTNPESTAGGTYAINAVPGTNIPAGSRIGPAGIQGPGGVLSGAASGDLEGTYPGPRLAITTTKGDLIANNNNAAAPRNTRVAVGANGTILHSDSAQAAGLIHRAIDLAGTNTQLTNDLRVTDGGTNASTATAAFNNLSPVTTRGDIIVRNATDNVRLAIGAANTVLKSDATDPAWGKVNANNLENTGATAISRVASDYILIRDEKAATTAGGTFTLGSWATHALTTEVVDTGSHATLAANQITLSAGTYRFRAWMLGYQVDNFQCRIQNITAGTTLAYGSNARSAAADGVMAMSTVEGRITVGGATVFELQAQSSATKATDGYGLNNSFGGTEVYASVEIHREAQ